MPRSHDELQRAIWTDERGMPPETREVALALAHVLRYEPAAPPLRRARELLGATAGPRRRWRIHDFIAGDAPRYDCQGEHWGSRPCEGPRVRPYRPRQQARESRCLVSEHHPHAGACRFPQVYGDGRYAAAAEQRDDRVCGAPARITVDDWDPVTGRDVPRWFCARHRQRAAEVRAQVAARGTRPDPIPNAGGLLPRYFAADWAAIYARHCARSMLRHGGSWRPPHHGVDADEWPVPGRPPVPRRPRLALVQAVQEVGGD